MKLATKKLKRMNSTMNLTTDRSADERQEVEDEEEEEKRMAAFFRGNGDEFDDE